MKERTNSNFGSRAAEWAAAPLLLIAPLVIFLRHQEYPLLAPECLICIAAFLLLGLALAGLSALVGNYFRVPLVVLLVTLFVDFQLDPQSNPTVLAWVAGGSLVLGVVLRTHLSSLVSIVCGTLLVTSILFPVSDPSQGTFHRDLDQPADPHLPPIVHLILDEQIGVAGIPAKYDRDGSKAAELRDFFLNRGFDVYGKAYSVALWSRMSIGSAMNFTVDRDEIGHYGLDREYLGPSAYFTALARRGYRIHVYQSDHINYCQDEELNPVDAVESCFTYPASRLASIKASPMTNVAKAKVIAGVFSRLSFSLTELRFRYEAMRTSPTAKGLGLPRWRSPPILGPLVTMEVFDRLVTDLAQIKPGHMVLAHLLLPHKPFAYDEECALRPDPYSWIGHALRGNHTAETVDVRQELYLSQVHCTLKRVAEVFDAMKAAGRFTGTQIIVHGDHGSRITFGSNPQQRLANLVAKRSTLFAFHEAAHNSVGTYLETRAPINLLLPEVLKIPGRRLADQRFVPIPDFEAGQVIDQTTKASAAFKQ